MAIRRNDLLLAALEEPMGIFRSTDDGEHWLRWDNGIAGKDVLTIACNTKGDIFAGTY